MPAEWTGDVRCILALGVIHASLQRLIVRYYATSLELALNVIHAEWAFWIEPRHVRLVDDGQHSLVHPLVLLLEVSLLPHQFQFAVIARFTLGHPTRDFCVETGRWHAQVPASWVGDAMVIGSLLEVV